MRERVEVVEHRNGDPADDVVEATLESEFGVYHLASNAPPPVPAFEDAAPSVAPPQEAHSPDHWIEEPAPRAASLHEAHSLDDWIEEATSHRSDATTGDPPSEPGAPEATRDDEWS